MIQSLMTRLQGQKGMEKTMVVMVFLLLVGLSQASLSCKEDKQCRRDVCIDLDCKPRSTAGGRCNSNSHCVSSATSCINEVCSLKSTQGGTCDANDNADCVSGYKCVGTSCAFDLPSFKWEGNKAMANERTGAASVAVGGFLFVFGGRIPSGLTNSVEMYDPSSNTWVSKANVPVSTWKHSVVAVGNFVYLIGGADASNNGQTYFFRYDTVSNVWTTLGELPSLPASLHSMAATVVGSTIFTLGGQSGYAVTTAKNNIYSFDTSTGQWTTTLPSLPLTLTQASAVTVGSVIYITGGVSGSIVQTKTFKFDTAALPLVAPQDANLALTARRSYHASFFNPISNKIHLVGGAADKTETMETLNLNNPSPVWTSEPTAILNLLFTSNSGGLINNRIYLPGTSDNPVAFSPSALLYVLDITSSPKWVPFAPSPSPSASGLVAKVGSSIITAGGANQFGSFSGQTSKSSKYSISSNTWSSLPDLPVEIYNMASAMVGSEVYSIGGYDDSSAFKDTYALNAGQTAWIQKANLNVARFGLCAASEGNRIFAFGGVGSSSNFLDTMEIYDASLNTWTDVTSSSKSSGFSATAVVYCAAVSTGTKILIFGGLMESAVYTGKIQSFDIATQKWDAPITSSSISRRAELSATVLNGFVIVSGGSDPNIQAKVEAYEISTGIVSSLPDMPSPRSGHGSVTDGDSVLVVGGTNGGLVAPVEKFRAFP